MNKDDLLILLLDSIRKVEYGERVSDSITPTVIREMRESFPIFERDLDTLEIVVKYQDEDSDD